MRLTYQRLVEIRSALALLKDRRLPNLDAELLVAGLWFALKPHFEAYDEMVQKLGKQLEQVKDDPDTRKTTMNQMTQLHQAIVEVPEPKQKLTKDHLPREYKGESGEGNSTANAGIIIALGNDYFEFN